MTQVLSLLDLAPEVVEAVGALGDPLPEPVVGERSLRTLLHLKPPRFSEIIGRQPSGNNSTDDPTYGDQEGTAYHE
ncbi:MAG: hypothetical protein ACYC66_18410 [Chloroflexota bacterium]